MKIEATMSIGTALTIRAPVSRLKEKRIGYVRADAANPARHPRNSHRCRVQSHHATANACERADDIGSDLHRGAPTRADAGHEDLVERRHVLLDDPGAHPRRLDGDLLDAAPADRR